TLSGARLAVAQYATSEDVLSVRIDNAPPIVTMTGGEETVTAYEPVFFEFGVTDASAADRADFIAIEVDWGDGQVSSGGSFGEVSFTDFHAYTHPGTYTVRWSATDKDGGHAEVTQPVEVSRAAVRPDPVNVGQDTLVVAAPATTSGNNRIQVKAVTGGVVAIVDGWTSPVFQGVDRVVVYGNEGDDDIQVAVPVPTEVYGGDGNDRIKSNGGHDVLVGDLGDDMLVGNGGRDFVVGGEGADKVVGNADDDILVGGIYSGVSDPFAGGFLVVTDVLTRRLASSTIMAEWTSGADYFTRVDRIRYGTEDNIQFILAGYDAAPVTGFQTVFDDAAEDKLTGDAGHDWFFANVDGPVTDKITDVLSPEFTDSDREFIFT
ncbi:MAG TPA: PKD domain-containing protein, partial [Tepidisphaeraceae bacterium]|nr:PKD domain-containing protein [Tepidisphaeraceae bacterium]